MLAVCQPIRLIRLASCWPGDGSCQVSPQAYYHHLVRGCTHRHSSTPGATSMPLLNGQQHELRRPPAGLRSNEEVFVLRFTGEVFKEYE